MSARSQRFVLGTLQGVDVVERMMCQLLKGFTREEESLLEDIFFLFCGKEGKMRTHVHGACIRRCTLTCAQQHLERP